MIRPPKGTHYGTHLATHLHCEPGRELQGVNVCWLVESQPGQFYRACAPFEGIEVTWVFRYATIRRFEISELTRIQVDALQLPSLSFQDRVPEDLWSFRANRQLDDFRHPGFPDDLATVYGEDKELENGITAHGEQVWVRVQKPLNNSTYLGALLNQPTLFPGQKGGHVVVRVLSVGSALKLVSSPAPTDL